MSQRLPHGLRTMTVNIRRYILKRRFLDIEVVAAHTHGTFARMMDIGMLSNISATGRINQHDRQRRVTR